MHMIWPLVLELMSGEKLGTIEILYTFKFMNYVPTDIKRGWHV